MASTYDFLSTFLTQEPNSISPHNEKTKAQQPAKVREAENWISLDMFIHFIAAFYKYLSTHHVIVGTLAGKRGLL